ncbi:MAG: ATP-binding protein [Desulfobacterales bacterium]
MGFIKTDLKIGLIVILGIMVTILHYKVVQTDLDLHILHRELYFLPILLTGFWFGLKAGAAAALIISSVYAPHVFLYQNAQGQTLTVLMQIGIFILVGVLLGWLVDRRKQQQKRAIAAENLSVLGRAAATVGYEMEDILKALRRLTSSYPDTEEAQHGPDAIEVELNRLDTMIGILKSFVPAGDIRPVSLDLNQVIQENLPALGTAAHRRGIVIRTELDPDGCPIMVDKEGLVLIVETLIGNGLDASTSGQTIMVRTVRDTQWCRLIVEDEGAGILPEHIPKIFTPFFTTKEYGQGLALAVCKKTVSDWGGEIKYQSSEPKGAIFIVSIPRDVERNEMISKIKHASKEP